MSSHPLGQFAFLSHSLSQDEVDSLTTAILQIPGYSQSPGANGREEWSIPLNFKSIKSFAASFPVELLARHSKDLFCEEGETSLDLTYALGGDVSPNQIRQWLDMAQSVQEVNHHVELKVWATPSKLLGPLRFRILMSWDHEQCFRVYRDHGFSKAEAGAVGCRSAAEYDAAVIELLTGLYTKLNLSGARFTDKGTLYSEGPCDLPGFWEKLTGIDWLRSAILKAEMWPRVTLQYGEQPVRVRETMSLVTNLASSIEGKGEPVKGFTCLKWQGFREVDPDWMKMASFAARMEATRHPVEMPLGFLCTGKTGSPRIPLILYKFEQGSILAVRGGNDKLTATLSQHFGIPWVKGQAPLPIPGKLGTPGYDEPPDDWKVPAAARKIPPFFTRKSASQINVDGEHWRKQLEGADYLENYPAAAKEQALADLVDGAGDSKVQLEGSLSRWHEPAEWTQKLELLIQEIVEASYGLFTPKNLTVEFEDDDFPPDPGSELRIEFEFAGQRHRFADEFYHGSIPHLLLPFLQRVMEENCNGVALRQVFKGKPGHALCTAGALERLKKAYNMAE